MSMDKVVMDDSYMVDMADYFDICGKRIQETADSYIELMSQVAEEGIPNGQVADSIREFLSYAEQLRYVILETSMKIRNATENYVEEINEQERYVY